MATIQEDIRAWIDEAKSKGATHLIVACDTFDHEDYPIPCMSAQECRDKFKSHNGPNMQKVMEVYDLSLDIEEQLNERRAMHLPA